MRDCPCCGSPAGALDGEENGWALARCPRCGARFTVAVPTDAELEEIYNRLYSEGDSYQMHLDEVRRAQQTGGANAGRYRTRIFLDRYSPEGGNRLLEVGCGVGTFMMAARARGWDVEGIDLSETAVQASREIHQIPVRVGSFFDLEFEPRAYDAIVTWEVLEHLIEPRAFLSRAKELLKPGGVLVFSVPNEDPKVPDPEIRGPASVPPVHLNFWDRDALKRFLELNGYRVERMIRQRTMLSFATPREQPLRFGRLQLGALIGVYQGIHLFAAARPAG